MHPQRRMWGVLILMTGMVWAAWSADSPELRALARQVNAAFRALDNLSSRTTSRRSRLRSRRPTP